MVTKNSHDKVAYLAGRGLQIRIDSLRATTAAGSGHPTSCLSMADMIAVLFFDVLRYDYAFPTNPNNDRFILSKGHAVPGVYAALHGLGVISEQELLSLRRVDSSLEGHPTPRFAYNEAATGSLGQGLSIGLGMAINARYEGFDYRTYVMMGDGELAEGSVWEAAALAAHERVDKLIGFVDCNRLGQSCATMHAHECERYADKFRAFGWHAVVIDGHDIAAITDAVASAQVVKGQPSVIVAHTIKGYGVEGVQDQIGFHGKPFTADELPKLIATMTERFKVSAATMALAIAKPPLPAQRSLKSTSTSAALRLDFGLDPYVSSFAAGKKISTRKAFGYALATLGRRSDKVFALDGDVGNSTYTEIFQHDCSNRFVQCFIAEQNMIGVATGLALRGKIPFAATFGAFFARAYDQVRMAGVGGVPLRLCGSHSGVSIGQDGPSQMGLEDLGMMRAIPQSIVLWPSDGISTYKLVEQMAQYNDGVSYMKSTRADVPLLYKPEETFTIGGCKVLRNSSKDSVCLVAAGITVHEALEAHRRLLEQGVSVAVIDLYSIKPIDTATLLKTAAAAGNRIITVEDHYPEGGLGEAVVSALCNSGIKIQSLAVRQLSRSGSPEELLAAAGIDAASIVAAVLQQA